ncbi:hypothetical protein COLO4_13236 [Corchorus olitorius]|uniref:Secreted protein n=1 Tax=Corchorus olitorius TaxID=93759 RepID=A0A1R3JXL9_9ROSI|nr:hypothetical protein COLO4_13236 [Corchorus olitorius]
MFFFFFFFLQVILMLSWHEIRVEKEDIELCCCVLWKGELANQKSIKRCHILVRTLLYNLFALACDFNSSP